MASAPVGSPDNLMALTDGELAGDKRGALALRSTTIIIPHHRQL